jgi:arsenate reductase
MKQIGRPAFLCIRVERGIQHVGIDFDYVITVCDNAKERCPFFPTKAQKFHHNFPDPAKASGTDEQVLDEFRSVREMVKQYCTDFIKENNIND